MFFITQFWQICCAVINLDWLLRRNIWPWTKHMFRNRCLKQQVVGTMRVLFHDLQRKKGDLFTSAGAAEVSFRSSKDVIWRRRRKAENVLNKNYNLKNGEFSDLCCRLRRFLWCLTFLTLTNLPDVSQDWIRLINTEFPWQQTHGNSTEDEPPPVLISVNFTLMRYTEHGNTTINVHNYYCSISLCFMVH